MSGPRSKPTRNDVARLAGTSPAVVSYVVNDGPRPVAPDTRKRVQDAIDQLGYRPNGIARSLRGNRSNVIGLLVPDNSNPFFAALARAIEVAAYDEGYTVLLGNAVGDDARELRYARTMVEHRIDGLVLSSTGHSAEVVRELTDARVPLVLVDRHIPGIGAAVLAVDNEGGGFMATRHLIGHGHTRIACVAGPGDLTPSADRHRGWSRALRESGLLEDDALFVRSRFDRVGGYHAAQELLRRGGERPTAIFACTDQQAIGVLRALAEADLSVPGDVAVVGFDGIPEGAYMNPPLATVRQPIRALGARAVELLLQDMRGTAAAIEAEVMPVELTPNASCGCPRRVEEED
ncbi:MAG: LacI family regulatory protein [Conexibacter sp.]|jgi:LacI family transcriptional regulator|nr:LacI family regulatory protein [Conexibacter sp.]